jgi:hypothetical protein
MRGLPAAGPTRTKVLSALAVASLVLGGWALVAVGSGSLPGPVTKLPFGPNAFAFSRNIVREGAPSGSSSTPTTTVPVAPPTTKTPPTAPSTTPSTAAAASDLSSPKQPPRTPPGVQAALTVSPSNPPAISAAPTVAPGGGTAAAGVARELIASINSISGGKYRIPVTADNVALLERWMANEGGLWADNPLNTSLDASEYAHQFTSGGENTGIPIFPTMAAGVAATAKTLLDNGVYAHILGELRPGDASCVAFATAVIHSPWAASHYGNNPGRFCEGVIPPVRGIHKHHRRAAVRVRSAASRKLVVHPHHKK